MAVSTRMCLRIQSEVANAFLNSFWPVLQNCLRPPLQNSRRGSALHNANRRLQTPWPNRPTTFSSRWFQRRRVRQSCCGRHAWRRRSDNITPIADRNAEVAAGTGNAVQDAAADVDSASPGSRTAGRIGAADLKAASLAIVADSDAETVRGAGHA